MPLLNLSPRRSIVLLFVVAWVLRIVAVFVVQSVLDQSGRTWVIEGDAEGYWILAQKIVAGEPYEIYTPPRQVLRMPGFPLLLAGSIALFGKSLFAARLVLATVGALGCVGVYWLGLCLFSHRVGLIAGGLAAVSPIFVGFSAIELTETAFAVAAVFGLIPLSVAFRSVKERPRSDLMLAVMAGLLAGVGCYMRPSWLLFPPALVAFLWLLRRDKTQCMMAIGAILVLIASLLPWGFRNERVTNGHFVLTTLWMGPSLYDGWNPGNQSGDSDMRFFDQDNVMATMSEYEMDQHYRKKAWQFAFDNPNQVAHLAWKKTLRYWNPFPNAEQFARYPALKAVSVLWYAVLFLPALIGAWKLRRELGVLAITAGPILYFAALHLVFASSVRYRLPGEYPLLILTAVGMETLFEWRSRPLPESATTPYRPSSEASPRDTIPVR